MSRPIDVLAVAAHPDDAEVGCAGALLRCMDAGLATAVVDLTDGERSTQGDRQTRASERDAASAVLGLSARIALGLPDGGLNGAEHQREALVAALRDLRPRVVLAPYPEDRHPDHAAAGRLARDACFLAGVGRYGTAAAHRPAAVFHYLMHQPFAPSFVIDVTAVWDRRAAAVAAYASQFGGPDETAATALGGSRFLALLDARASWFGAMIGVSRGEPFWSPGPIGLDALPDGGGRDGYRMFV